MKLEYATILKLKETLGTATHVHRFLATLADDEETFATYSLRMLNYECSLNALQHSSWDHEWTVEQVETLEDMLIEFADLLASLGYVFPSSQVRDVARMVGLHLRPIGTEDAA